MALLTFTDVRLNHPSERDASDTPLVFVLRLPLSAGVLERISPESAGNTAAMHLDLVAAALVSWPYDVPPSRESIRNLDLDTYNWLVAEVRTASNITDDEKNASGSNSSPTMESDAEPTLPSSGI